MGNLLINSCRKRSRVGGVGGAGVYSNLNPYNAGGGGYGYDGYGGNRPYGFRNGYGAYGSDVGNEDLTRRQFLLQQRQQQAANLGNMLSYDYNTPSLNYDYNTPSLNYDYDYPSALNYNSPPRRGYAGYSGLVRRGRSVGVEDLIAQEGQAVAAVVAPPGGLVGQETECRDTLNPNAVLVLGAALAVTGAAVASAGGLGGERRGEERDPLDLLTQAISKYSSD